MELHEPHVRCHLLCHWHGPLHHLRRTQVPVPWGVPVCSGPGETERGYHPSLTEQDMLAAVWEFLGQILLMERTFGFVRVIF